MRGKTNKARLVLTNCFQCDKPSGGFYCIEHERQRKARDKKRAQLRARFKGVY